MTGIDWAIAQNSKKGSPYKGKLDAKAIAVMGQSCGGMQAIANSGDPRIKTTMVWNSGILRGAPGGRGGPPMAGMVMPAKEEDLKNFHAPVAYIIGGPSDVAYAAAEMDFKLIEKVAVFYAKPARRAWRHFQPAQWRPVRAKSAPPGCRGNSRATSRRRRCSWVPTAASAPTRPGPSRRKT